MKQIQLTYGFPKETVTTIMMLYKNTKAMVCLPDGDTEFFDIVAKVLQGDTLASRMFIICLDLILRKLIDLIKKKGVHIKNDILF